MHDYRNIIVHHQDIKGAKGLYMGGKQSVSAEGFEPSTNGLKGHCSAVELRARKRNAFYHARFPASTQF
jgi:hypothetical protein